MYPKVTGNPPFKPLIPLLHVDYFVYEKKIDIPLVL